MDDDDAPSSPFDSQEENLSISIDTFFKILDEEPGPPPPPTHQHHQGGILLSSSGTVKSLYQDDLSPGQVKCEKDFHPQSGMLDPIPAMGNLRRPGTSPWDSSNCMGLLDYYSNDWLSLSTSEDNTLMDSGAASINGLISDDIDYQEFENNIQPCGASHLTVEMAGLLCPMDTDPVNGLYLDSKQEKDFVQMEGKTSFQVGSEEKSISDIKHNSSLLTLQPGGIDSSHNMLRETSVFNDSMHVEERNVSAALSTSSSSVPGITLPDTIYTEADTSVVKSSMCNANNNCLLLPTCYVQTASMQISDDQFFQPSSLRDKGAMIHRRNKGEVRQPLLQNSCMTSEVKLGSQEETLGTSVPVASVIDLDETFPEILCDDQIRCEVLTFNNESSTDSSPVPSNRNSTSDIVDRSVVNTAKKSVPDSKIIIPTMKQKSLSKDRREDWISASRRKLHDTIRSNGATQRFLSSSSADEDADISILDDISDPARPSLPPVHLKLQSMSQRSEFSDSYYHGSGLRLKADDERLTLRVALQDLSQPKSESSPPIGVLNVPLLRHQRIALSWMVQKETTSLHCSGGILADDQGLGKTISTIALILMERSPPSRSYFAAQKPDQLEALNVDDDDNDGFSDLKVIKQLNNSSPMMMSRPTKRENSVIMAKGRPAAGTLVVCPTSVLRQWADELQNKVSTKANLSFLMYYGSNRTKDPNELAKYDVVLTTYAIVSMEVPKQPLVDKDGEEKGKVDTSRLHSGLSTSNKRKNSQNSNSRNKDSVLLEFAARPLARVGWFRVVLDEAQSIKNYRTQVARACWGLRAKRRWCLSGTPIQNAVDDLYSYFRFLRYDPYAVYKSFCSLIKMPISRNPTTGYQKLQLVLKTIMLRRTKGTLLDGKPIINLPPKTITLKKVDFSEGERAFYSTLEAESREQFKEYAAAGTVKQNYVNILLMLLRLRQACDHPLLVKAYDSNSTGRSSMDMVKKLPRDEQVNLLSCLEACFAICTICNDPPEDAVVTICGHVFCNQCICEHLTGDDNICPSALCKTRLTVASVFSRGTLKSCLSGEPDRGHSSDSSIPHMANMPKTCEQSMSSDSSKIKTALGILQSLPISQGSAISNLEDGSENGTVVNAVNTISVTSSLDTDSKFSDSYKPSKGQATEKAIVFSQWTRMLDMLEVPLKASRIQYRRLDGTMSVVARDKAVKDFNTQPEVTVMIMSLKAASLGLNMVAACHVLLLDLWWNPTTEDQAIDRAHRIGQTRPVTVSRLTVRDTVEDRILALQEKKREMVASAFGEDEAGTRQSRLTVEDLKYLFMA